MPPFSLLRDLVPPFSLLRETGGHLGIGGDPGVETLNGVYSCTTSCTRDTIREWDAVRVDGGSVRICPSALAAVVSTCAQHDTIPVPYLGVTPRSGGSQDPEGSPGDPEILRSREVRSVRRVDRVEGVTSSGVYMISLVHQHCYIMWQHSYYMSLHMIHYMRCYHG